MWKQTKRTIVDGLVATYGVVNIGEKVDNFIELGIQPLSIIAYHNVYFQQVKDSYIMGSYYPALTGACSLGERILNHLILTLRDHHKGTPEYQKVFRKKSFDNWDIVISTLEAWGIFTPDVVSAFNKLKLIRNKSIHFNLETENSEQVKKDALEAIHLLTDIISFQFSAFYKGQPWLIPGMYQNRGIIKKGAENLPFVKEILVPNSEKLGYAYIW
ncbi:hypothetical protein ACFSCX_06770 [Bacillus salitolerans]|uniref:DUF4145 domain-containing protein n=1 Tax=Bacillus salitolerans TaxID=1437434 RepID=A0ABW4LMD9_9BACI